MPSRIPVGPVRTTTGRAGQHQGWSGRGTRGGAIGIPGPRARSGRGTRAGRLQALLVRWGLPAFCLYLTVFLLGQQMQLQGLERREAELLLHRDQVVAANAVLREHVARLASDEYLEQAAREELGMVRPGEIVYTVGETGRSEGQ
jgi:hypothetical protein